MRFLLVTAYESESFSQPARALRIFPCRNLRLFPGLHPISEEMGCNPGVHAAIDAVHSRSAG
jgi:hypothetical protein